MYNSMSPAPTFGNLPPYQDMYGYYWDNELIGGGKPPTYSIDVWGAAYQEGGSDKALWWILGGIALLLLIAASEKD